MKKTFITTLAILITVLITSTAVQAIGTLTPSGTAGDDTQYSLNDIYNKLSDFSNTYTEDSGTMTVPGTVSASFNTLSEIYALLEAEEADLVAGNIADGTTIFGVEGTLEASGVSLADMFNGTGSGFDGGSQEDGGVDDYMNGGTPPNDRFEGSWTACTSDNNYCDTGLSSADAKDNNTGLVWSLPCNGVGCSSFSDSSPGIYAWYGLVGNNDSKTAPELCSSGNHGESGWTLPNQKQMMMAYINGSYGNLENEGASTVYYWSATTLTISTSFAFRVNLAEGYSYFYNKVNSDIIRVRCVR
jgi:hypothetical protein